MLCNMRHNRGFTLIEIMVALVILALSLTAAVSAINHAVSGISELQEKTIASWVAEDVLTSVRLGLIAMPDIGQTQQGSTDMLAGHWQWRIQSVDNHSPYSQQIDVSVLALDGHVVRQLTGYVYRAV